MEIEESSHPRHAFPVTIAINLSVIKRQESAPRPTVKTPLSSSLLGGGQSLFVSVHAPSANCQYQAPDGRDKIMLCAAMTTVDHPIIPCLVVVVDSRRSEKSVVL